MSICPNKDLFSAYIDGEVSSPWKEKLEQHIQVCPVCRKVYMQYTAIHNCMQISAAIDNFDPEQSFNKLLAKRAILTEAQRIAEKKKAFKNPESWFSASIRIPVPAAAAAVLIFVLVPLLLFFKIEDTVVSARNSFTPILPVSLEKQRPIAETDLCSLYTHKMYAYTVHNKTRITNTKLFTVSEFTRLYSQNDTIFQPAHSTASLKISLSQFPLVTNYRQFDDSISNISMMNNP